MHFNVVRDHHFNCCGTPMRKPFIWNEIEMWTGRNLIETVQLLDEDDVESFMTAYVAVCGSERLAEHNLRYIMTLSFIDRETAEALSELFMIECPGPDEVLQPRHWFGNSSLGIKETI